MTAGQNSASGSKDTGSLVEEECSSQSTKPNGQNITTLAQEMKNSAKKLEVTAMSLRQQQQHLEDQDVVMVQLNKLAQHLKELKESYQPVLKRARIDEVSHMMDGSEEQEDSSKDNSSEDDLDDSGGYGRFGCR